MRLLALAGTNSVSSTNRQMIAWIAKECKEVEVVDLDFLPLFDGSKVQDSSVDDFISVIKEADGLIISTPEYDHSAPAVLLNALAWLTNEQNHLWRKPIFLLSASYGRLGGIRALEQLRQVLTSDTVQAYVFYQTFSLSQSLQAFDKIGQLLNDGVAARLKKNLREFLSTIDSKGGPLA
ncbi:NADPH-dependent oxidoreductase [Streptococcus sp. X16XC17]|uniref:NADPH-dependent FMN reductase n=1 Tax=unclassified Streptococcus TaxID=2608887 RepID=UPI00066FC699|nr:MULTISPECIES: NAD(P)H-dependent oxidoreductase [unclassified Streptococcus]TCD46215.1 NADPH-dependent oxidoreductase [Streptococcus sp. X16XC17]